MISLSTIIYQLLLVENKQMLFLHGHNLFLFLSVEFVNLLNVRVV